MPVAQEEPDSPEPDSPVSPPRPQSRRRGSAGFSAAAQAVIFSKRQSRKAAHPDAVDEAAGPDARPDTPRQDLSRWNRRPKTDAEHGGRMDQVRAAVWVTFENPNSSWKATAISTFILGCIVVSSLCIHLESMPSLENYSYVWAFLELFFVVVFSFEYAIRYWATPMTSSEFIWERYNLIDLIAIMPFYLMIVVELILAFTGYHIHLELAVIRTLRLCRIFKVAKYSHSTQLLLGSLQRAAPELTFLLGFMSLALVFFGTLMYAVEQGEWDEAMQCHVRPGETACSPFESIPGTFYWGVTTMTTVGYGDVLPVTRAGTFVACMTMFMGILVIALPVTMISNAFMDAHDEVSMEVKLHSIKDKMHLRTPEERELIESSLKLRELLSATSEALEVLHVTGAELLMAQGKCDQPEDALQHWDDRIGLASQVARKGLSHLKQFAVILQPNFVS